LGAFLKIKNQGEKTLALGYFISGIVGGVTEPVLDGILSKYVGR
jgi:PTS system beta-glucosides-specific IIC component